jgi:hypothetical protein
VCADANDHYLAAPSGQSCGQQVKICRADNPCKCTTGTVKDHSVTESWEAGPGIFSDLGAKTTEDTNACKGTGEVPVTYQIL